jgi:hypothetical protein
MIEAKRVEIRDRATCIPAVALRLSGGPADRLLWRAGYGPEGSIMLIHLTSQECRHDAYAWPTSPRTMREAHIWLAAHWFEFYGGVLDVEYILGEVAQPKTSEVD